MITEILSILSSYGQSTTDQIKQAIPKKTGKTAASVRFQVEDNGTTATLRLTARPFFLTVQTGRKPTPQYTKPSKEFVQAIREWLQASGSDQGPAYAIAKSIHQKGTKLWQQGGNTIISDIVNESLTQKISTDVLKEFARYYLVSTVNLFNDNSNQSASRA
jgi:hypothetical protein